MISAGLQIHLGTYWAISLMRGSCSASQTRSCERMGSGFRGQKTFRSALRNASETELSHWIGSTFAPGSRQVPLRRRAFEPCVGVLPSSSARGALMLLLLLLLLWLAISPALCSALKPRAVGALQLFISKEIFEDRHLNATP